MIRGRSAASSASATWLTGSLEGDGQRLRAAVDLVDAATGEQVWSERYDRPLEEFFAVQDELAERIAGSVGGLRDAAQRVSLEEARGKPTRSLQAYELWLQADEERRRNTKEANAKALELLRQAIQLDPQFGRAYVTLAYTNAQRAWNGYAPFPRSRRVARGREPGDRAPADQRLGTDGAGAALRHGQRLCPLRERPGAGG